MPAILLLALLLFIGSFDAKTRWTLLLIAGGCWLGFAFAARERVIRPLQTIANMIAGLREDDFSIRARGARSDDDLGLAFLELNTLGETLRQQRLGAEEASALLNRVISEIDVAVFAFDEHETLRLANRAGTRLLARPLDQLVGRSAEQLGLAETLKGDGSRVLDLSFTGRTGRYGMRRSTFRQRGRPHLLVVLADLSRALRDEERQAWQRLIRVLGHEINNSLAPIKSVAQTLQAGVARNGQPSEQLSEGLALIAGRAESLSRFMNAYARLARLPRPRMAPLDVDAWVRRVAALERRVDVRLTPGPAITVSADGDQLDQVLINLLTNAADASLQTGSTNVELGWEQADGWLDVFVRDEGPGLPTSANLFVPFFTTKPNGSGIGLALSRQIAEGHGGTVSLQNRKDGAGCEARLRLPVQS